METLLILLCLILSCFVGQIIGFAGALVLIPLLSLFIDPTIAIVLVSFWGFFFDFFKMYYYRKFLDKKYIKTIVYSGMPGVILGSLLISVTPIVWIKLILTIFVLTYAILKIKQYKKKTLIDQNRTLSLGIIVTGGFSFGFLGGLIGASGPINVAMLEGTGHYRENFIGNFAASSFPLTIVKLGIYTYSDLFPTDYLLVFVIGIPIIFLISKLGYYIAPKIPKDKFQIIVLILVFVIAIRLLIDVVVSFNP